MPKCVTTCNAFAYFWHETLVVNRSHSNVELPGTVSFCPNTEQFHAGMCTFGSQIIVSKVCKYIKSGHNFGSHAIHMIPCSTYDICIFYLENITVKPLGDRTSCLSARYNGTLHNQSVNPV
jgi:hypothetical protein